MGLLIELLANPLAESTDLPVYINMKVLVAILYSAVMPPTDFL